MITAASGYWGQFPLMWILMATAVAFMAATQSLLRSSEYRERKNPLNKIIFVQTAFNLDLVVDTGLNRKQRRSQQPGTITLPARHIEKAQLGVELRNDATFPISMFLESADSTLMDFTPPRSHFPKPPTILYPGLVVRVVDDPIDMGGIAAQNLSGTLKMKIRYGLPGKERFEMNFNATAEIHIQPFGIITGINTQWL